VLWELYAFFLGLKIRDPNVFYCFFIMLALIVHVYTKVGTVSVSSMSRQMSWLTISFFLLYSVLYCLDKFTIAKPRDSTQEISISFDIADARLHRAN
jgi:hypothetical protein